MEKKRRSTSTSLGKECVSFGCSNRNYNPDGSPSSFSFFKFPTKNPSRNVWCNLVKRQHGRDGFKVTESTVICDQHFKESDIYRPPGGSRRRLKKGNVYIDNSFQASLSVLYIPVSFNLVLYDIDIEFPSYFQAFFLLFSTGQMK